MSSNYLLCWPEFSIFVYKFLSYMHCSILVKNARSLLIYSNTFNFSWKFFPSARVIKLFIVNMAIFYICYFAWLYPSIAKKSGVKEVAIRRCPDFPRTWNSSKFKSPVELFAATFRMITAHRLYYICHSKSIYVTKYMSLTKCKSRCRHIKVKL